MDHEHNCVTCFALKRKSIYFGTLRLGTEYQPSFSPIKLKTIELYYNSMVSILYCSKLALRPFFDMV